MIQLGVIILALALLAPGCNNNEKPPEYPDNPNTGDKALVWSDEFDYNGLPDSKKVMTRMAIPVDGATMSCSTTQPPG